MQTLAVWASHSSAGRKNNCSPISLKLTASQHGALQNSQEHYRVNITNLLINCFLELDVVKSED